MNTLITRVEEIVKESKLSTTAFANSIGVAPSNFFRMLRGEITITQKTLRRISDTHGISMEWLVSGEGDVMQKDWVIKQKAIGDDINQMGNNSNNVTNSTELLTKAFDEIAAQRRLTESTQRLLESAHADNHQLLNKVIELIQKLK